MKILILSTLAIMSLSALMAQKVAETNVPAAVSASFKTKFPKAEKAKWELENKTDYEANFKMDGQEQSALFNPAGQWMETEMKIAVAVLPQDVQKAISQQFPGYKIKEAEKVEKRDVGKLYEVELTDGKRTFEIAYSSKGLMLGKK